MKAPTRVLSLALVLVGATPALAGNQDGFLLSDDAAIAAGAVSAVTVGGCWYNPAGLGAAQRSSVSVSTSAFVVRFRNVPGILRTQLPGNEELTVADLDSTEILSAPGAIVAAKRLSPGLALAATVFVPQHDSFPIDATLRSKMPPLGGGGGDETWSYVERFSQNITRTRYHIGGSIGWQVHPNLRVGASIYAVYLTLRREFSLWASIDDEAGDNIGFGLGQSQSEVDHFGLQLVAGLQWAPDPRWRLAAVVRSPALNLFQIGEVDDTGAQVRMNLPGVEPYSYLEYSQLDLEDTEFEILVPLRATLAVAHKVGEGWLSLEGDITAPVQNLSIGIDRELTFNVRVGGSFAVDEEVSVGGGLFTDRSPDKPPEAVGEFDVDYYGATVGFTLRTQLGLVDDARPDGLTMSSTFALRYAVGIGEAGGVTFQPLQGPEGTSVPRLISVIFHELGLHIGSSLRF